VASFQCVCENPIDLSPIPKDWEWIMLSNIDYCQWNDEGTKPLAIIPKIKVMLECPDCGRLWFFRRGFAQHPEMYEPTPYENKDNLSES
jgi:hypothetical protein